jgi:ribosome biogenesis GTPase / thiamine phosphate phosphatase
MLRFENLRFLGWSEFFEDQLSALEAELPTKARPARVISEHREHYRLQFSADQVAWGEITGKTRHEAQSRYDYPAVGDWVLATFEGGDEHAVILRVLKRRTCLARKAAGEKDDAQIFASNVDTVFVMTSLNQELNLRRIERYLVMIGESGAEPVLALTKSDLVDHPEALVLKIMPSAASALVVTVSARTGEGFEKIQKYFQLGKTSVLVGSSGVGKSTLINRMLGHEVLRVQEVRQEDAKGRHTTTARELVHLPTGGMIIDTPGIRELQLLDDEGLHEAFPDITELALRCKFTNCQHASEPGCRIKAALESGELAPLRWENFNKLQRELLAARRKRDKAFAAEEKNKMRKSQQDFKRFGKRKPR